MIGEATQKLFEDVFEKRGVFEGLHRIERRIVQWGPQTEARALPHAAAVAREQDLLERLPAGGGVTATTAADWIVFAGRPLPETCEELVFGDRIARATAVMLAPAAGPNACWVESLDDGWLFLVSHADRKGWLLSVGEASLERSELVRRQIAECAPESGSFPASPRIAWPLCGPGWIACGTGALGFDPLCGEGAGNALRESILASAVLRAVAGGESEEDLLDHYRGRLLAGFERHLAICREYYSTGGSSPWWRAQKERVEQGLAWCTREREALPPFHYRLENLDLKRIDAPSTP